MKRIWDVDELAEHWSLKFEETRLLKTKPARNHLPFSVQLKFWDILPALWLRQPLCGKDGASC